MRQLRNYLERCVVLDEEAEMTEEKEARSLLPEEALFELPFSEARAKAAAAFVCRYLRRLMDRHEDRTVAAARAAEIDRAYLYKLLKKCGLR